MLGEALGLEGDVELGGGVMDAMMAVEDESVEEDAVEAMEKLFEARLEETSALDWDKDDEEAAVWID